MSFYRDKIAVITPNHDPRHVEAMMRLELGTLDNISASDFEGWAKACALAVEEFGADMSAKLADSMGIK